jgi:hypothetical protein
MNSKKNSTKTVFNNNVLYLLLIGATGVDVPEVVVSRVTLGTMAIQAILTGTGDLYAAVVIEAALTQNAVTWLPMGNLNLSGTDNALDEIVLKIPWLYIRARLLAITGINASVSVNMAA